MNSKSETLVSAYTVPMMEREQNFLIRRALRQESQKRTPNNAKYSIIGTANRSYNVLMLTVCGQECTHLKYMHITICKNKNLTEELNVFTVKPFLLGATALPAG